ncbi:MAG: hypothetical protein J5649_04260 [Lachnospiraceae bacterium]|nr:hypothetical protein [Lachnospiraceae bacterium]
MRLLWKNRLTKGSFTVEAALCVPTAFLVLYMVLQLFVFLRIQSDMQVAMNRVVRELSQYGTVYSQLSSMSDDDAEDIVAKMGIDSAIGRVASEAYMGYLLRREIRDADWIGWIRGGVSGVSTSGSSMFDDDGQLLLTVSYRFAPVSKLPVLGSMPIVQRTSARSFFGLEREVLHDEEDEEEEEEEMVYVSARGTVYHRKTTCSFIKLSVRQIEFTEVAAARNKDGEIYRPCEFCCRQSVGSEVFITDYGNRYHTTLSCGELKRTIQSMTLAEAQEKGLRACKKCGGETDSGKTDSGE